VEIRALNQSVIRNASGFMSDFMFELTNMEWGSLRSQIVTSNRGGIRYMPYAFTEQGGAMLSSVLRSNEAIEINLQIIRAFILTRQSTQLYTDISQKLENFIIDTNLQFNDIYLALQELAKKSQNQIGKSTTWRRKVTYPKSTISISCLISHIFYY
jgi:hypothetical protein